LITGTRTDVFLAQTPEFQLQLEQRLASHFGRQRAIARLDRRFCPYTSSHRLDELDVRFEDGSEVQLVMKDMSDDAMLEDARRARPEFLREPSREIDAYRWILPYAPRGTATSYGAVTDPDGDRHRLFLERVDGLELRHVGDFSAWEETARWIARFHRSFPHARLRQLTEQSSVLVYDEAFYWRWLRRAERFGVHDDSAKAVIDRIARCYEHVTERLVRLPPTLIHGELYPCNVLISEIQDGVRICPVDWEMVALAPGLIDLASLTTGWAEPKQRALAEAYFSASAEGQACGHPRAIPDDFFTDLDCCRLHLTVRMLGWSDDWVPPPQHALDWLTEAEAIMNRLER
jgi:hypothetical protein